MGQQTISVLKNKFADGKTPTGSDFGDVFDSYLHKSGKINQTQVLGLNEDFATKHELNNATTNNKGIFSTDALLKATYPIASNKKGFFAFVGSKNPFRKWEVQIDGGEWIDTAQNINIADVDLAEYARTQNIEGIVARRRDNGFVLNPSNFRKYDIEMDSSGNVGFYRTSRVGYALIDDGVSVNGFYETDEKGWVIGGIDWKGRDLRNNVIYKLYPSLFDITIDSQGNAFNCIKSNCINDRSSESIIPDKLSDLITDEVPIIQGQAHYGFPGICAGKTGVLHAFYRKGIAHTGIDGSVMYSYSRDFGKTWNDGGIAMQGGEETDDGYYSDWRDCKAIRMSNGKFLLSQTRNYAKPNGGTPPNHVDYDTLRCRTFAIIYNQKSDFTLDIANPNVVWLPLPNESQWLFGAGGLVEHDGIIYITAYGGTSESQSKNAAYLYRSLDFGLNWEFVSEIYAEEEESKVDAKEALVNALATKTKISYNENTIAFLDDVMFCVLRGANSNARIVKSTDFGKTWEFVKDLTYFFHGMYALGLDNTIMVAGRHWQGATNIVFFDNRGNYVLEPILYPTGGDSAYADICTFENYIHIIYYAQLSNTSWGIFTRKVERSKVLGLGY